MRTFALTLLLTASALQVDFSNKESDVNPVTRVVNLLKDMSNQLEVEAKADEEAYNGMGCWCETNDREKTQAIAAAQQRQVDLEATIQETAAKAAQMGADLQYLGKQVAQQQESLNKASAIREKEQGEFREQEKDMLQSSASLKTAVSTLGKVQLNQLPKESLAQVQSLINGLPKTMVSTHRRTLMTLLQNPSKASMLQQKQKVPSSAIFGILKQMKEEFESNIKKQSEEEANAVTEFLGLKEAKNREMKSGNTLIATKQTEQAQARQTNAESKQDWEETSAALSADTEFLMNLKLKCKNMDKDYQARVKVRTEEIGAVSQATSILTDSEARTVMGRSTFIQVASQKLISNSRNAAAVALQKAGSKLHSPKLVALAMSMRMDAFAKVKENIDNVVVALKAEQGSEREQKDFCVASFNENEKNTALKTDVKKDLEQEIASLESKMGQLMEEINVLNAQVKESQIQMKRASENREQENKEFQLTVADQRATQQILKKALDSLTAFYNKKAAAAFLQAKKRATPGQASGDMPEQAVYKKSAGASGVMSMIESIVQESEEVEKDATQGENDSQAAYESFIKDSNASVDSYTRDIVSKTEDSAKADEDKTAAQGDLRHTDADLYSLGETSQALHQQCDFLVQNFDLRQGKRTEEIEALTQAKAIFSGAGR